MKRPLSRTAPGRASGNGASFALISPSAQPLLWVFRGETEEDFQYLLDWLSEAQLTA